MPIVYKGRVFSIEVARVQFPNGREFQVETVRHPASVVLIPIDDHGRVILVRQFRPSIGRELWELPAGSLGPGEQPEEAAARECEEETGLVPQRIERLRGLYPSPGYCDEEMIFLRLSGLGPAPPDSPHRPDEDEDIHAQAFSVEEAQALAARGDIVDLKSAYGLTLL